MPILDCRLMVGCLNSLVRAVVAREVLSKVPAAARRARCGRWVDAVMKQVVVAVAAQAVAAQGAKTRVAAVVQTQAARAALAEAEAEAAVAQRALSMCPAARSVSSLC